VTVLVVFVIGEMLWAPTSTTIVAELAPDDIRGAYMGAFGSGAAIGFALAPLIGLQARNSFGDSFTWTMFAGISVLAAVLAVVALSLGGHRSRSAPDALAEA
jgi:MFS family permease